MSNKDEILQEYLLELENGVPLSDLLARLSEEDQEIILGLQLAASIRTIPHPEPLLASLKTSRQRVTQAARQAAANKHQQAGITIRLPRKWSFSFSPAMAIAVVAIAVVALTASVFGIGRLFSSPINARAARLMDVKGLVEVASSQDADDWTPVNSGDQVSSGERIRTYASSSTTLVFYEGTRATLGANTDAILSQINGNQAGVLSVKISQNSGTIANDVVPLKKSGSYIVQTPSGNASVKGTHFNVAVDSQLSRFSVSSGNVLVSSQQSQVDLVAGQATAFSTGEKPDEPAYQFSVQGTVTNIDGETWIVDGVSFKVTQDTVIKGNLQIGSLVTVQGRILEAEGWVADIIDFADNDQMTSSFTGIINSIEGDTWQISGFSVRVDANTLLSPNLIVGDAVQVTYTTQTDGVRLASNVELLQAEPDPTADPELEFQPDEIEQAGCVTDYNLSGSLMNAATGANDVAQGVDLGSLVERSSQYIQNVDIQPFAWDAINPGQTVSTTAHISLSPAWLTAPNGTEVKVVLFVAHETNQPDNLNTRLVITIRNTCQSPTATEPITDTIPTPSEPPTSAISLPSPQPPTPAITSTVTMTDCVGANPQPKAMKLAEEYSVDYSEIMGWFCKGYGFGEIDLAYNLSMQTGKPVDEIFALRSSGLGWGEIKQQLDQAKRSQPSGQNPPGKNNPNNKNNPNSNNGNSQPPGKSNQHKP